MKVNVNVKRTFKVNGKVYNSLEEMPDDVREAFKKATATDSLGGYEAAPGTPRTRIIFNGTEYEGIDAMPPDVRQVYEQALRAAETGAAKSDIDFTGIGQGMFNRTEIPGNSSSGNARPKIKVEPTFSVKTVIVACLVFALIFGLYYVLHSK